MTESTFSDTELRVIALEQSCRLFAADSIVEQARKFYAFLAEGQVKKIEGDVGLFTDEASR